MIRQRLRAWLLRWSGLFHKERGEHELAAEMETHLQMHIADNLRAGMAEEQARREALLRLGGLEQTKELYRERRSLPLIESLLQDLHFGARSLRKNPAFAAVAVLTLAMSIGANTAIFSVVNAVLLRPLPYPNHDRLLRIEESHPGYLHGDVTYASFLDLARDSRSLENLSAHRAWVFNLTGEGEPEQVPGAMVSANFFPAIGTKPLLGRLIRAEDDLPGGDNGVVVLSFALWQSRFGGDPAILGKTLQVNAEPFVVIGVMPQGFDFPENAKLWCPLVPGGPLHSNRQAHLLTVLGDLRRNETAAAAQGELTALAERIEQQNPGADDPHLSFNAISLKKNLVAPVRPALEILFFSVGLLLLIACANVANLLLARTATRAKEISVRLALGCGRLRLARLFVTESVLVSMLGGVLGLGLAWMSLQFFTSQNRQDLPRFAEINLDWRVFIFGFATSLLTGLLFGMAPALGGAKLDLQTSLKEGSSAVTRVAHKGSSNALAVLQFALAMVLLVGAALLGSSFARILRVAPGFNSSNLLTMEIFLSPVMYPERDPKVAVLLQQMLERIRTVPGVQSAGLVNSLPITGGPSTEFLIEGRPAPNPGDEPSADVRVTDPSYFGVMGIPLLAGRTFSNQDTAVSLRVLLINETMARSYWPGESPLGKRITMEGWGPPLKGEIVGVVGDVKTDGLDAVVKPMIYWPYTQFGLVFNSIVVRTSGDPLKFIPAMKTQIWSVDKNQPISQIATMDQILSDSLARRRLSMALLGIFAVVALLLAAVGVYGVLSYSVSQRSREIGIRLALGAPAPLVLRLILQQGAKVALTGIALGLMAALALTRLMAGLPFGVSPTDPTAFASVAILLTVVAFVACYIPARRAMRVDPIIALRHE
jgi:predicted permease